MLNRDTRALSRGSLASAHPRGPIRLLLSRLPVKYPMRMASHQTTGTVASVVIRFKAGDREAADKLFSILYPELRRLAALKMNAEESQHSWQPSLLVNELYLQLVK